MSATIKTLSSAEIEVLLDTARTLFLTKHNGKMSANDMEWLKMFADFVKERTKPKPDMFELKLRCVKCDTQSVFTIPLDQFDKWVINSENGVYIYHDIDTCTYIQDKDLNDRIVLVRCASCRNK